MLARLPPVVRKRLDPHERVLWWGRPRRGILFRRGDWFAIPFSIVWFGGVLAATRSAAAGDPSRYVALMLFFFLVIGLYFLVGRFIHDAWRRSQIYYALTPTRALIVTRRSLKSLDLNRQPEITLRESRHGSGTIIFGPEITQTSDGESTLQWTGEPNAPCFEAIEDARGVYDMMRRVQADLAAGGRPQFRY
jgi:hypothetical protein